MCGVFTAGGEGVVVVVVGVGGVVGVGVVIAIGVAIVGIRGGIVVTG